MSEVKKKKKRSSRRRKQKRMTILAIVLDIVLLLGVIGAYAAFEALDQVDRAKDLKSGAQNLASSLAAQDTAAAQTALNTIKQTSAEIRDSLDEPLWKLAASLPMFRTEFNAVDSLLDVLDDASRTLIQPGINLLSNYSLDAVKTNTPGAIVAYAEFAQTALPKVEELVGTVKNVKLGKLNSALGMMNLNVDVDSLLNTADGLLHTVDFYTSDLMVSATELMKQYPLDELKKDGTINAEAITAYANLAQTALPKMEEFVAATRQLDLSALDREGKASALLGNANELLTIANHYAPDLIPSATAMIQRYPLSELAKDNSYNVVYINKYLDYVESLVPQIRRAVSELKNSSLIGSERIQNYVQTAESLLEVYDNNPDLLQLVRNILGNGEDKCYLLAAMNSSEIRALGGFPGSMGVVTVKNGMLTIGDFESVYNILEPYTAKRVKVTQEEINLFQGGQNGLELSWDACLCPDFLRVVDIWTASYFDRHGVELDGIIAMTPTVIQKLLEVNGASIELSDGAVLDGTNATHQLQYDMYFRYFTRDCNAGAANSATDVLFAETANGALRSVFEHIRPYQISMYLDMANECFDERIVMMWMKDSQSQSIIANRGWDGSLNSDPMNPQAGVYFNCTAASKMGWFAEINSEIGEPTVNADASRTYPVTVKISNIITQEEIDASHVYIIGEKYGALECNLYLFGPAGGTIDNLKIVPFGRIYDGFYHGRKVGYMHYLSIAPGQEFTITYTVTTAPGVSTPLTISQTPSMTEFH